MKPSESLPLYWKVCLINGGIFGVATAVLVVSPATVSPQVTASELAVLASGLAVILSANAVILRNTLAPLDRLIQRMANFDARILGQRLPEGGNNVAATMARAFNELLHRLESERAYGNVRALAAQESERRRVAQELHDEVGQRLTVVLLGITRALATDSAEAQRELNLARDNARSSLDEVRRIVQGLRPGVLEDLGLTTALAAMANDLGAHAQLRITHHLPDDLAPLGADKELVIFRVAQEALTNVARHATANRVELSLSKDQADLVLRISDDGRGKDDGVNGEGIRGMRDRAIAIGGQLSVKTAADGGTEVVLRVPFGAHHD